MFVQSMVVVVVEEEVKGEVRGEAREGVEAVVAVVAVTVVKVAAVVAVVVHLTDIVRPEKRRFFIQKLPSSPLEYLSC